MDLAIIKAELEASEIKTGNRLVGLSAISIKNYISKIIKLNKSGDDYFKTIMEYQKLNSRLAMEASVLGAAKHSLTFNQFVGPELIKKINEQSVKDCLALKKEPGQLKSEKEKENWVSLTELKEITKSKEADFTLQELLLIKMYTELPPVRLDYGQVHIVKEPLENGNYLLINKQGMTLTINDHKTGESVGPIVTKLPKKITELISRLPITQNFLFETKANKPFLTADTFGVYLRNVFFKLTGKNLSVDILRHIYITKVSKGERSKETKKKLADQMGHSVGTQENYHRVN